MIQLNKIKGAIFGLAIGDALGGTTEFMKEEQVKEKYGHLSDIIGGGVWELYPGETTDDTAMTLAVAEGILNNPINPIPSIGEKFLEWVNTKPKDVGMTIQYALSYYGEDKDWENASKKTHNALGGNSAGNGSLMRCLPIALAYRDVAKIDQLSVQQSRMTHYDELAAEACVIYNRIAHQLLYGGKTMKEAITEEVKGTQYEGILKSVPLCLPTAFVVDTFSWVLRVLYTKDTFEQVVQSLANKGEDADTTAAIAGGLMGLWVGFDRLPRHYTDALIEKERLSDISVRLDALNRK